jgi:hypothetical protein
MKRWIQALLLSQARGLVYEACDTVNLFLGYQTHEIWSLEPLNATEHALGVLQNTLVMVLVLI